MRIHEIYALSRLDIIIDKEKGRIIVAIRQSKTDTAFIRTDAYIPFDDGITDIKKILSIYLNAIHIYIPSNKMMKNPSILWRVIRNRIERYNGIFRKNRLLQFEKHGNHRNPPYE